MASGRQRKYPAKKNKEVAYPPPNLQENVDLKPQESKEPDSAEICCVTSQNHLCNKHCEVEEGEEQIDFSSVGSLLLIHNKMEGSVNGLVEGAGSGIGNDEVEVEIVQADGEVKLDDVFSKTSVLENSESVKEAHLGGYLSSDSRTVDGKSRPSEQITLVLDSEKLGEEEVSGSDINLDTALSFNSFEEVLKELIQVVEVRVQDSESSLVIESESNEVEEQGRQSVKENDCFSPLVADMISESVGLIVETILPNSNENSQVVSDDDSDSESKEVEEKILPPTDQNKKFSTISQYVSDDSYWESKEVEEEGLPSRDQNNSFSTIPQYVSDDSYLESKEVEEEGLPSRDQNKNYSTISQVVSDSYLESKEVEERVLPPTDQNKNFSTISQVVSDDSYLESKEVEGKILPPTVQNKNFSAISQVVRDDSHLESKKVEEKVLPPTDQNKEFSTIAIDLMIKGVNPTDKTKVPASDEDMKESMRIVDLASKENAESLSQPAASPTIQVSGGDEHSNESQIPESTEHQPIISETPRNLQSSSWWSCCGLFEVLRQNR